MPPIIGNIIVIGVLAVVLFFCGRSVLRSIRAELRGEATCSGCSGGCSGSNGTGCVDAGCTACMRSLDELKELAKK